MATLPLNSDGLILHQIHALQPGHHQISTASASQSCTGSPSTNLAPVARLPGSSTQHTQTNSGDYCTWTCPEMGYTPIQFAGDHLALTDCGVILVCCVYRLIMVDTHIGSYRNIYIYIYHMFLCLFLCSMRVFVECNV